MSNMGHFVAYDEDGRIAVVVSCPLESGERVLRLNTDRPYIQAEEPARATEHYVVEGELKARPDMGGVLEGRLLRGVIAGASVSIENEVYVADGTDIELSFSAPGTYQVTVTLWPYRDQEFTVENPA
ncbi:MULTISPECIES: hypothetical protein [Gammaproteobacteria]|uniref:hypothetical protein n=1 Tax=Gammaproteobacteria TaxID=1236 RepID=UPI00064CC162|nr:hypothetical protein [Pseudomonas putida]